jgi:hypothetical protein
MKLGSQPQNKQTNTDNHRGVLAVSMEPAADEDGPLDRHGGDEHVQRDRRQAVPGSDR